jgi:hypothetical protein
MPKERVYGVINPDDQTVNYDLSFQWDRILETEPGPTREYPPSIAMVIPDTDEVVAVGYFDRRALNKLIRTAQKMRDQTFGPDA